MDAWLGFFCLFVLDFFIIIIILSDQKSPPQYTVIITIR